MHDNPQSARDARTFDGVHALPRHAVIEIAGRDAVAFAQAQTMNDLAAMPDGHWHWNGLLTPKGRVVALFALLRFSSERVWMIVADADPRALVASLERFVFRSKVAIRLRRDLLVQGTFAKTTHARGAVIVDVNGVVELDVGGDGGARALRIVAGVDAEPMESSVDDTRFAQTWTAYDLAHGWPRLTADQLGAWTPQQLSLERLNGYSVKKGCYPGQEIVARTHFLGKAKRGLILIEGAHGLAAGASLHGGAGNALGTLVCSVDVATGQSLALAVVPLQRDAGELTVQSVVVREIALHGGLAR